MTAPSILALVRHGQSTWIIEGRFQGQADPPLSDLGRRQAAAVGTRLAATADRPGLPVPEAPPIAIWHSPLLRAAQTAAAIHEAREADAPMRPLPELMELSQGEWEGLTRLEVEERYPEQLAAWRADPLGHHAPGGESIVDGVRRARAAWQAILGSRDAPQPGGVAPRPGAAQLPPSAAELRPDAAGQVLGYERTIKGDRIPWGIVVAHDGILRLLLLDLLEVPVERYWSFPFALAGVTILDLTGRQVRLRAHNLDEHVAGLIG